MKFKKIIKISAIIGLCILIIGLSCVLLFITQAIKEVKDINININDVSSTYCTFYNNNNEKINNSQLISSNYVNIDEINPITISAFISIEDKSFYEHNGLNYKRMAKAMLKNIINGSIVEGASTISQQLIKNKYLTNEKTLKRKIKEAYLTKKLEAVEEKDKIMEAYLNTIYYGNGAYGIANASHKFFNKQPSELTLNESCILAGVIKSPSTYSPINNMEKCIQRKNLVLKEMLEDKVITQEEYDNAVNEKIVLNEQKLSGVESLDLYSRFALNEASKILNIDEYEILSRGYKIYTYQDNDIQNILNKIITDKKYYHENSFGNIADSLSIILDNQTSGVSAVAGKSEYNLVNFKRQPGSLIKPVLVYTPALEKGTIYPCSQILDEKTTIENYSPKNVSDKYYGYVSIKDAVAQSLNIPAVKLCNELGVEFCKEYAQNCGLEFSENDNGLAIALGGLTEGFTLQNITESYTPFSNNGLYKKSKYIKKIISPQNLTLYTDKMTEIKYCNTETAYLMTEILKYSTKYGTSKKLSNLNFDIAGKTGTVNVKNSNLNTDAYSLAYTTNHTMSVWLGNYSMKPEYNLEGLNNGGTFATEIIRDTFNEIYSNYTPSDFIVPDTIINLPIDNLTLTEEHKVMIAKDIPDRYISFENFSCYNVPTETSTRFHDLPNINLIVTKNKNSCTLSFDTYDYLDYYIYRVKENNKSKLLKTLKDNNGTYAFVDNDLEFNTKYEYYIEVYSDYSNNTTKSNIESIILEKDYSSLLNNNDTISWLFT